MLSPPLRRPTDADLDRWAAAGKPLVALIPELDDYLRPDEARRRFARVPAAEVIAVDRAKHLWVGEPYVRIVMTEIVRRVNPAALHPPEMTLPTTWEQSLFRTGRRKAARSAISRAPEPALKRARRTGARRTGARRTGAGHARARIPGSTGDPGSGCFLAVSS